MNQYSDFAAFGRRTRFVLALILGVVAALVAMPVLAVTGADGGQEISWWKMALFAVALLVPYFLEQHRVSKDDRDGRRKSPQ